MPPTTAPRHRVKFKQRIPRSTRGNGRRTQRALLAALLAVGFGAPAALLVRSVVRDGLADPAKIARRFQVDSPVSEEPLLRLPTAPATATVATAPVVTARAASWSTPAPDAPVTHTWEKPFVSKRNTTALNPSLPVPANPVPVASAPRFVPAVAGFAPMTAARAAAPAVSSVGQPAPAAPALANLVATAITTANIPGVESAPAARPGLTTGAASLALDPRSHAVFPAVNAVPAPTFTWSGVAAAGSTPNPNWSTSTNWVGNTAPGTTANADIIYAVNPTAATATNVNQTYQINSLTFQAGTPSYNVTQSSFTYLGVGAGGISDASASAETLSVDVYATADNTINVSNATGRLNMPGAVPNPSASPAVPVALYLQGTNRTVTVDGPGTTNITGVVAEGTSVVNGKLVKSGAGTLILAGNNTYTGGTTLNAGVLDVQNNNALGSGPFTVNGGRLIAAAGTFNSVALPNAVTLNGTLEYGFNSPTFAFSNVTLSGPIGLGAATRTVTGTSAGSASAQLNLNGVISATGTAAGLTLNAATGASGFFAFGGTGTNTYAGTTTVDGASLFLQKGGVSIPGDLTIQNGGSVQSNGGQLAGKTNLVVNGNNSQFTITGGGSETFASLNGNAQGRVLFGNQFSGSTLTVGQGSFAGVLQDGFLTDAIVASPAAALGTTGGVLVKNTIGTLTLSGNNTYTGGTLVSAGALFANNVPGGTSDSATGSGDVIVLNGARLGGIGSVGRPTVQGEGTIPGSDTVIGGSGVFTRPGLDVTTVVNPGILGAGATLNSRGVLTINGNLTLTSNALLETELGGTTAGTGYDQVRVGGAIALGGDLSLATVNGFALTVGQTFFILDGQSVALVTGTFANVVAGATSTLGTFTDAAGNLYRVNYADSDPADSSQTVGNDVSVTVLAVPEPGTWMILGVGALAGLGAAVRRRRQGLGVGV